MAATRHPHPPGIETVEGGSSVVKQPRECRCTKVTIYAQWRSSEDYQAMREDPAPLPYLQQALAIATFEPGIYEVVQIFSPAGIDA
jgi:hypothetical protein